MHWSVYLCFLKRELTVILYSKEAAFVISYFRVKKKKIVLVSAIVLQLQCQNLTSQMGLLHSHLYIHKQLFGHLKNFLVIFFLIKKDELKISPGLHSALTPQGLVKQGFKVHLTNGSPSYPSLWNFKLNRLWYFWYIRNKDFMFWNLRVRYQKEILVLTYIYILLELLELHNQHFVHKDLASKGYRYISQKDHLK